MAGALERVLELTVQYAGEREQFGRPIARFQAVGQMLAELAGEHAAARAATDVAVRRAEAEGPVAAAGAIAVAKVRAGQAAGLGAELAHQVHGAIGYTDEHRLHHVTRRLWSWRDEHGGEAAWGGELGRGVLGAGGDGAWAHVVALG
jgi:acyl-CoA dehydrogenase